MSANKSLFAPKLLLCLMLSVVFAGGCNKETNNDGAVRGAVWAVSADCRSCLENQCATPEGVPAPAQACAADAACSDAFLAFTNCYKLNRSLQQCESEVKAVKAVRAADYAGTALLQNCFLLDCFGGICESPGK